MAFCISTLIPSSEAQIPEKDDLRVLKPKEQIGLITDVVIIALAAVIVTLTILHMNQIVDLGMFGATLNVIGHDGVRYMIYATAALAVADMIKYSIHQGLFITRQQQYIGTLDDHSAVQNTLQERDDARANEANNLAEAYRLANEGNQVIRNRDHTIEALNAQIRGLQAETQTLRQRNTQAINETQEQARQKVEAMEGNLLNLQQSYDDLIITHNQIIQGKDADVVLHNNNVALRKQLINAQQTANTKGDLETVTLHLAELKEREARLQGEIDALTARQTTQTREFKQRMSADRANLAAEIANTKAAVEQEAQRYARQAQQQVDQWEQQAQQHLQQWQQLGPQVQTLQQQHQVLSSSVTLLQQERQQLEADRPQDAASSSSSTSSSSSFTSQIIPLDSVNNLGNPSILNFTSPPPMQPLTQFQLPRVQSSTTTTSTSATTTTTTTSSTLETPLPTSTAVSEDFFSSDDCLLPKTQSELAAFVATRSNASTSATTTTTTTSSTLETPLPTSTAVSEDFFSSDDCLLPKTQSDLAAFVATRSNASTSATATPSTQVTDQGGGSQTQTGQPGSQTPNT